MRLDRRAKIKLLLRTLPDMQVAGRIGSDIRAPYESRLPARGELWYEGSYADLERCLDAMKPLYPKLTRHLLAVYGPEPQEWGDRRFGDKGFDILERRMPSNVFVPQEISENAGYLPSDAKTAARPRAVAA